MATDIRKAAKKVLPGLLQAKETKLNEADTVQRVMRFFQEVLGYHPDTETSRELTQHGRFLDIAIKIEGKLQLIVEVKQAGTDLQQKHLDQALRYANEFQTWWAVLTNGTRWVLYRFVPSSTGIQPCSVLDVDLSDAECLDRSLEALACLHRGTMTQASLENLYERNQAASPKVIARALFTEDVLKLLAREVRREQKILFDSKELKVLLEGMFSEEVVDEIGNMRVKKRRQQKTLPNRADNLPSMPEKVIQPSTADTPVLTPDVIAADSPAIPVETSSTDNG